MALDFEKEMTVTEAAIDRNGHVNNVCYVEWMQDVAIAHSRSWGIDDWMTEQNATWFARRHEIIYVRPVFLAEVLTLKTQIETDQKVRSVRRYQFVRGEELVAEGTTDWVFVDRTTGKPKRIPRELAELVSR